MAWADSASAELQELAHTSSFRRRVRIGRWLGVIAVIAIAVVAVAVVAARSSPAATPSSGIVRVMLKTRSGTGFFVAGPDELAYVVTAYHVIDSGEPILIERTIEVGAGKPYVEAYPDVEVVAFDADSDLAVLRLDNVRADHFTTLQLADAPVKDEAVLSYGFPASSLSKTASMMSKPGKILSLVKFPVIDRETGTVIRDDAVDGLLVSSDIEAGFSGGPTCDARGNVVGINVTKDLVHRGQNGAVSVTALSQLLARVTPAKTPTEPTPAAIAKLLTRIETEYLLLPIEARSLAREQEFVSDNDRPRLEQLITEIRKLDHDTVKDPGTQLSGQAMLGIALMRLPGRPLETYTTRSTRERLQQCELRERGLEEFFGSLGLPDHGAAETEATRARCAQVAFRPLVWDLTALALEWEGKVRDVSVVKVEAVDAGEYRAQVRFANLDHLVDVWLATDGGRLRLKLFDKDGRPAGLSAGRAVRASAFEGTWHRTEPRTARSFGKNFDADVDTMETVAVSVATDGVVSVTHDMRRHIYENRGRLPCGSGAKLDLGFEQIFSGLLDNGSVVAARQGDAKAIGTDMWRCGSALTYDPDRVIVLKLVEGKLEMYRTNGVEFPEVAEFER
ncbi:MAG TPA: serine protease [Kofleriaceae bacterium]|jgi:S1-C subfamily serine protease